MSESPNAGPRLIFIFGAQRSGTTMLERMLSSHSMVKGGPEPHLLTPLAHTGYWRNVTKAHYDHIVAALGQRAFIESLPSQADDYWRACRSYCDTLYCAFMNGDMETLCVDKTPEYSTIWPFITQVYPDAKYIVLTRHPAAIVSSFANSFFDGDYALAHEHEPILARYIPALAAFLGQEQVSFLHVRYEDLVTDPALWMERICDYLEVPFEQEAIEYGRPGQARTGGGLGDPINVAKHSRPSESGMHNWAAELKAEPHKLELLRSLINQLDPKDLEIVGYPVDSIWDPLEEEGCRVQAARVKMNGYRLQRKLIVRGRQLTQRSPTVRNAVSWLRVSCDVLLREY
ncbi:MAG: sulfotransferase family protein [Anaerolineae bacterium]